MDQVVRRPFHDRLQHWPEKVLKPARALARSRGGKDGGTKKARAGTHFPPTESSSSSSVQPTDLFLRNCEASSRRREEGRREGRQAGRQARSRNWLIELYWRMELQCAVQSVFVRARACGRAAKTANSHYK